MKKLFRLMAVVLCFGLIFMTTELVAANQSYSFIVKYKENIPEKQKISALNQVKESVGHGKQSGREATWERQAGKFAKQIDIITIHNPIASEKVLEAYRRLPFIEYIEPDYPILIPEYELFGLDTDDMTMYSSQLKALHGEESMRLVSTAVSEPVVVALLDSGVDYTHTDLSPYLLAGYNFVNETSDVMDYFGHGTMMAGQIVGQESYIKVLPVKVISDTGTGNYSDLVEGIYYAVNNGAKIINLSLGSQFSSDAVYDAIEYAKNAGVVVVAAAGNYGNDCPIYPAALPGVLAIGATGTDGNRLGISNYGDFLNFLVPGEDIYTTYLNGTYRAGTGTSLATAIAANMVAQVIGQRPDLTGLGVAQTLKATADDMGKSGWDRETGFGVMNVATAVQYQVMKDFALYRIEQNVNTPRTGQTVQVDCYVRNSGVQTTYEQAVSLTVNGEVVGEVAIPLLEPGQETKITIAWTPTVEGVNTLVGEIKCYDDNLTNNRLNVQSEVTSMTIEQVEIANLFAYYTGEELQLIISFDLINRGNVEVQMPLNVLYSNVTVAENELVTVQPGQTLHKEYAYSINLESPEGHSKTALAVVSGTLSNGQLVSSKLDVNLAGYIEPLFGGTAHKLITQYLLEAWGGAYAADGSWNGSTKVYKYRADIISGSVREDDGTNWMDHGWDPDKGVYAGWNGWSWPWNSAYERCVSIYQNAMNNAQAGKYLQAFFDAGRTIHLLEDMAVPSHAHGDMHPFVEYYEKEWIPQNLNSKANLQKYGLKVDPAQVYPSRRYTQLPVSTFADYKSTLMYMMAELGDNFDSENASGEATYGNVKRYEWDTQEMWVLKWVSKGLIYYPTYVKEYRLVLRIYWLSNAGETIAKYTLPVLSDYVFDTLYWYKEIIK